MTVEIVDEQKDVEIWQRSLQENEDRRARSQWIIATFFTDKFTFEERDVLIEDRHRGNYGFIVDNCEYMTSWGEGSIILYKTNQLYGLDHTYNLPSYVIRMSIGDVSVCFCHNKFVALEFVRRYLSIL